MSDTASSPNRVAAGVGWMLLTTFLFLGVTGVVRHVGSDLPNIEAAFLRYLMGVILILPWASALWRTRIPRAKWGMYALRGALHSVGVMLWFYAMARIPIAEVTAIGYIAPIFVTIGAAVFLGERLQWRRIGAVISAFVGALIILRPGFQELNNGQLAQLCAAPAFAASFLLAKRFSDDADSGVIVFMLSFFCTIALIPGAIWQWVTPTWGQVGWMALTAAFATAGHWTLTQAYRCAPITVTQPVQFLQLVWATALGVAVFAEPVDPWVLAGGGIIVGAATYISHREAKAARRTRTPAAAATKT